MIPPPDTSRAPRPLAVALAWHVLDWPERLALVRLAEARGYDAAYVDGDVTTLPQREAAPALDGWTVTTALLASTARIAVGSIRLVHHWNAPHLAQCVATLDHLAPGRLRFLVSVGGQPADARFGWPWPRPAERIAWLDETLTVVRRLWAGETVSFRGRFVRVDDARVRPQPPGGRRPIAVAGRGRALLGLVARHADVWDVNLPPLPRLVRPAVDLLDAACQETGRDPGSVGRSMWLFARPGWEPSSAALAAEYRRWNPWFAEVQDAEIPAAVLAGSPERCRERLAAIRGELGIDAPVLDLSGLPASAAREALLALAP